MPRHCISSLPKRLLLQVLGIVAASAACATGGAAGPRYDEVAAVVALSDIHGANAAFVRALGEAGVIDDAGAWAAADRHLVITGDLLDRGPDSRAAMDLLMRLETEAAAAGGRVHLLLGNHEVMNLVGDLRYVSAAEYTAFAAEETAEERASWRERFVARALAAAAREEKPLDPAVLADQFERAHPPGFFAHRRAFRPDGIYGAWLLGKPLVEVINDTVFVHGGISPAAAGRGLERINRDMGEELDAYVRALATLTDAGLLYPGDSFYAHRKILEGLLRSNAADDTGNGNANANANGNGTAARDAALAAFDPDIAAAIATVLAEHDLSIHDQDAPVWYRGHVGCPAIVERDRLEQALAGFGAERIVIGHTPTVNRQIVYRFDKRLLEIDTGMLNEYYGGSAHALTLERSRIAVVAEDGSRPALSADPRPNGRGALGIDAVESRLAEGEVLLGERRADGSYDAEIAFGDETLTARFFPNPSRRTSPALAAWRLDRLLGIGLVPVTVARTVGGERGALQAMPLGIIDEAERSAAQAGGGAWCPLPAQWAAMYVFDTLIGTDARSQQQILYDREAFKLFVSGSNDSFGTGRGRPRYLAQVELEITPAWRAALASLTDAGLAEALGDAVSTRQRRALLTRRDALLDGAD